MEWKLVINPIKTKVNGKISLIHESHLKKH